MLTGNWHQFNVLARTTFKSILAVRSQFEGEAASSNKRILNVLNTPKHHNLEPTSNGFVFHLREWNFVLKILSKMEFCVFFSGKKCLNASANGCLDGIMMIIINKNTLCIWGAKGKHSLELLLLIRFFTGIFFRPEFLSFSKAREDFPTPAK